MSLASNLGTLVGTGVAYIVHYYGTSSCSASFIGIVYTYRHEIKNEIQNIASAHALDTNEPEAVQNNLLNCLEYID
jgi:hypothetical protein